MVINLLFPEGSSERDWESIDAVVGGANGALDDLEAAGFAKRAPGASGRAELFELGDLLDRSVFDERTGAEAINHGEVSCLVRWSPAERAVRGGFVPAGDLISM
jgi:hypothetical protein